jgi:hypothetical protein
MRLRQTVVSGASVTRLLGVALLARSAAACSSDASRFSYKNTDQLTTASVPQPSAVTLAPLGTRWWNMVRSTTAAPQPGFPQALPIRRTMVLSPGAIFLPQAFPQSVSQAFPGDYRSPVQPAMILPQPGPFPVRWLGCLRFVRRTDSSKSSAFARNAPAVAAPSQFSSPGASDSACDPSAAVSAQRLPGTGVPRASAAK